MGKYKRFIACLVIACLTAAGFPMHASAAIVGTREATAPTGMAGGEVIGVLFAILIILLVTDILGLTKVFPFTRSIR